MNNKVLVVTTDPITTAVEHLGKLSVIINANDVAVRGARPLWFLYAILLPELTRKSVLKLIVRQAHIAAKRLGISIVGGHSEITPGVPRPIVLGTMIGETSHRKFVTTGGAKPGDDIILTKGVGIEGTAIIASDFSSLLERKVSVKTLRRAQRMIDNVSIVKEALIAVRTGGVTAMHDPTEGGIMTGLWEMAEASGVGVTADESTMPISNETETICTHFELDPLKIMSSGSLLIAVRPKKTGRVLEHVKRSGVLSSVIGSITRDTKNRILKRRSGRTEIIRPPSRDELYSLFDKQ